MENEFKIMELKVLEDQLKYGPDFICIGAQKSCTSWLHWNLLFHPDTSMPPEKEVNYFCCVQTQWHDRYNRLLKARNNEISLSEIFPFESFPFKWYEDFLFSPHTPENYSKLFPKPHGKISGDLSPSYSLLPDKWIEGLSKEFPTVKIIYLLRNPVERTWSQFKMEHKDFLLTNPKEDKLIEYIEDSGSFDFSNSTSILNTWERYFPGRIKVWFYDQIRENPRKSFLEICEYLNISPNTNFIHNKIKRKVFMGVSDPMPLSIRRYLNNHFQEELLLLNQRFDNVYTRRWLSKYRSSLSKVYSWYFYNLKKRKIFLEE